MKRKTKQSAKTSSVYERIRQILESARTTVARSVNTTQVIANWLIGREIVEELQKGQLKAQYGKMLVHELAGHLQADFGKGYSALNLWLFRRFYQEYPMLTDPEILYAPRKESGRHVQWQKLHAVRGESDREISRALRSDLNAGTIGYALRSQSATISKDVAGQIGHAARDEFGAACENAEAVRRKSEITPAQEKQPNKHAVRVESSAAGTLPETRHELRGESWQPGQLHPNLSWTHYRTLLRVDESDARAFYEIEAIKNNWSARELERQINSLLYERLAMSRDKNGLMKLATKGHEIQKPADVFKDPVVMEFLGLPESPKLVESALEEALIGNLQAFLLEMGKGFAFVARQERLTLDGDHFYIDLVFYHTILKCYVIIDLKTGKLTHQDLGQLQLYVNYYDRERRTKGDGPTLGLILCTDKNDTVVKYTLGADQQKAIFASRYKLHLPSEAELRAEIRREIKALAGQIKTGGGE
jgi:predicted nuclease of restriction endonuclease-like (RecB) superfamily